MPDGSLAMALAIYGKHPAKGDFLEYGLPADMKSALEGWLDTVLGEAKASLGADWQAVWPSAPMLRFWLGESIWGAPIAGVMAATQDKVGRKFPLVLLALGEHGQNLPPPVIDTDQTWYDGVCAHLTTLLKRSDVASPATLLQNAPHPLVGDTLPGPRDFWAACPGANVSGLLADIALTDHRRANDDRSYWWVGGHEELVMPDMTAPKASVDLDAAPIVDDQTVPQETAPEPVAGLDAPIDAAPAVEFVAENWNVPEQPETDASPFASDGAGPGLFAAPEVGLLPNAPPDPAPQIYASPAPKQLWSQVWAGSGLPSGAVLAWFFRGHAGND